MLSNKTKNKEPKRIVQAGVLSNKKNIDQGKQKEFPRSYRLDSEIMNTLKNTLDRVNQISPRKVSEARLVKALILFSREMDEEKLMKYLKEVW